MANVDDVEHGDNIQDSVQFLLSRTRTVRNINKLSSSIDMISSKLRSASPQDFKPRRVCIGPLHRNDKNLLRFENKKAIFMDHLFRLHGNSSPPEEILKTCVEKVKSSIDKIKECYDYEEIKNYSDTQIESMMVMDACFILEFLYMLSEGLSDDEMVVALAPDIICDLMLVENQIPFFVLQEIFECTRGRYVRHSLKELVFLLLRAIYIFGDRLNISNFEPYKTDDHLLGLIHDFLRPRVPPIYSSKFVAFQSAAELDRAGVSYKPHDHSDPKYPLDIELEPPSFSWRRPWAWGMCKPTLRMPVLYIHDNTEMALRNLLAYELFSPLLRNHVRSFVIAMDALINDKEDVAILVQSKVLVNSMGSDKDAAKMINNLTKDVFASKFLYAKQIDELNSYYDSYWPKNIAWLKRTYFSNPWSVIALFAGIIVFLLTLVQTYVTINPL